jgi:hypothetical protein
MGITNWHTVAIQRKKRKKAVLAAAVHYGLQYFG